MYVALLTTNRKKNLFDYISAKRKVLKRLEMNRKKGDKIELVILTDRREQRNLPDRIICSLLMKKEVGGCGRKKICVKRNRISNSMICRFILHFTLKESK